MAKIILAALTVTIVLSFTVEAEAQLFGNNRSDRSQARKRGGGTAETTGTTSGNERFMRGNRRRNTFVGSTSGEARNFVGSEQATATGRVQSTTAGIRQQRDPNARVNRPFPKRAGNARYSPRLVIGFDAAPDSSRNSSVNISGRLQDSQSLQKLGVISVSVVAGKATLRGEVLSESDRKLAAILVGFEPGIADVRNDLIVNRERKFAPPPVPPLPGN
jgi:hypothetical protein